MKKKISTLEISDSAKCMDGSNPVANGGALLFDQFSLAPTLRYQVNWRAYACT